MIVSPFTPLFFVDRKADGIESGYIQTFSVTDRILVECLCSSEESFSGGVFTEPEHKVLCPIAFQEWQINERIKLRFATMSFNPGCYSVVINGRQSRPFMVTDNPLILEDTTLIQYSHRDNRQREDVVFFIDGMQYFFDFRVHGGFKDSNWSFGVECEQFVTPSADISQLFGLESTQKKFTLGGNIGVPVWFAEMLNRILVCSHVYFDGVKYVRKDSSVPEMTVQLEGLNSFVFSQLLQQSRNLDPVIEQSNNILMRRVAPDNYRAFNGEHNRII